MSVHARSAIVRGKPVITGSALTVKAAGTLMSGRGVLWSKSKYCRKDEPIVPVAQYEVHGTARDRGPVVRERVEFGLARSPVEAVRPVRDELAEVVRIGATLPRLRAAASGEAGATKP